MESHPIHRFAVLAPIWQHSEVTWTTPWSRETVSSLFISTRIYTRHFLLRFSCDSYYRIFTFDGDVAVLNPSIKEELMAKSHLQSILFCQISSESQVVWQAQQSNWLLRNSTSRRASISHTSNIYVWSEPQEDLCICMVCWDESVRLNVLLCNKTHMSLALLVYNCFLSLPLEISEILNSHFSAAKLFYLLNRYGNIAYFSINCFLWTFQTENLQVCYFLFLIVQSLRVT